MTGPELPFEPTTAPQSAVDFNRDSRAIQLRAGVDPTKCLRLREVSGDARTIMAIFFANLRRSRTWISPQTGDWRDHDIKLHRFGVRNLHPQSVALVVRAAGFGEQLLEAGNIPEAKLLSSDIDFYVDRYSNESYRDQMAGRARIPKNTIPSYNIQVEHYAAMHAAAVQLGISPDL